MAEVFVKSKFVKFLASVVFTLAVAPATLAQNGAPPIPSALGRTVGTGWITVYIRSERELPVSVVPQITITSSFNDTAIPQFPRLVGNGWVFSGLPTGATYELDVKVDGYQPVHETVLLADTDYATANAIVSLRPLDDRLVFHPPSGHFLLAPRAQKEVQQGLRDLRSNKTSSAQKHFQKAILLAPANPYVNYVMGLSYLIAKQPSKAQPFLEESVSVDPGQEASLLALGTLRFDEGNYPGAIDLLTKAAKVDPSSWKSEWLLANAYLNQREYADARDHARKAITVGGQKADPVKLVIVEATAALGDRAGAQAILKDFLAEHPRDPGALKLNTWLATLPAISPVVKSPDAKTAIAPSVSAMEPQIVSAPAPPTALDLPPKPDWAPPDVDASKPYLISGAGCSLPRVLRAAGKTAAQLVTDLQQFTAKEEYQSVEIKREGLQGAETENFNYLMFIDKPRPDVINVQEVRDMGVGADKMPRQISDSDAALALVLHPLLQGDFTWSCEGLGKWKDNPAWIVRFEQRGDRPNHLATLDSVSLPLKGKVWISENGGQVLHLEADLIEPLPEIKLTRDHFVVDYEPVNFKKHKVTLWLPENVNVYFQYRGHYVHNYHHFSNFQLFWTGSSEKIGQPKAVGKSSRD